MVGHPRSQHRESHHPPRPHPVQIPRRHRIRHPGHGATTRHENESIREKPGFNHARTAPHRPLTLPSFQQSLGAHPSKKRSHPARDKQRQTLDDHLPELRRLAPLPVGPVFCPVLRKMEPDPYLVTVPGPMFMGVYLNEDHREQLETGTPMVGASPFEDAVKVGSGSYAEAEDEFEGENPDLQIIETELERQDGVILLQDGP